MVVDIAESVTAQRSQSEIVHVAPPVFPAQKLAGLVGVVAVLAGALGFIVNSSFDTGAGLDRGSLLGFDVNAWSNVIHLLAGLLLLAASRNRSATRAAWRLLAFATLVVLLSGLIDGSDVFGLVPVNTLDHVADAVLLVVAIVGTRTARENRGMLEQDRLVLEDEAGPRIVGPGTGHIGGPRRNVARIDARL